MQKSSTCLKMFGFKLSEMEIARVMSAIDEDYSGLIELDEFIHLVNHSHAATRLVWN